MPRAPWTNRPIPAVAALVVALLAPAAHLHAADPRLAPALEALAARLEAERTKRRLPSLSYAVVRDDAVVARRALGEADLARRRPATPEHVYRAGSITKLFVATALMQQVERGTVRLDDPLSKYVPEYRPVVPWPDTPATTLRQLASHTSGLPRDAAVNFWMNHSIGAWPFSGGRAPIEWYVSRERLLETLPTVELVQPPDGAPLYSNLGMALLAIAVERASGTPFPAYVEDHVLRPLNLADTALLADSPLLARLPVGYVSVSTGQPPLVAPEWQLGVGQYTGGLVATPTDLARFAAAWFPASDGRRSAVLSQPSHRLMLQPVNGSDAALGWWTTDLEGHRLIGHTGGHFGFLASVGALPSERLAIAIMTNSWNPVLGANDTWELTKTALADLARALAAPAAEAPPFEARSVDLARYVGRYGLPGGFAHLDLTLREGKLWFAVRERPSPPQACEPVARHRFSCGLEFREDAGGRVNGVRFALFDFRRDP